MKLDEFSKSELQITSYTIIRDLKINKDGNIIFHKPEIDLNQFLQSAYQFKEIKYSKFYKMDVLSKLGFLASEFLLSENALSAYKPDEIGVILSNANSSLETDIKYYETVNEIASPALFVYTLPNIMIGEICIRNGIKGENSFFIMKEFNPQKLIPYVGELFKNHILQACIFGWVECLDDNYEAALWLIEKEKHKSLSPFTIDNVTKNYYS
jgi:hypothetical protein